MPKRGNKGGAGMDRIVQVPFRVFTSGGFPTSAGTTVTELDLLAANLGQRVAAIAPSFEYFRISRLSAYAYTDYGGVAYDNGNTQKVGELNASFGICFVSSDAPRTGTPTSITQMSQYECFAAGNLRHRLKLKMRKDQLYLATPTKWYDTTTTGSTQTQSAGLFYIAAITGTSTNAVGTVYAVLEGVVQFKDMISPSVSKGVPGALPVPPLTRSVFAKEEADSDGESVVEVSSSASQRSKIPRGWNSAKLDPRLEEKILQAVINLSTPAAT